MAAHRRFPGWLLGAVGLWTTVLLQPALPGWCGEPRQQNLQGSWKLNADLTASLSKDQHAQAEREAAGRSRAGLGAMGPTGGGPNDDLGLGDWSPAKERHDAEERRQALAFLDSLTIVQQGGQVTITDQGGHARDLKPDGSKVREEGPAGPALLRASWDREAGPIVAGQRVSNTMAGKSCALGLPAPRMRNGLCTIHLRRLPPDDRSRLRRPADSGTRH